MYVVACALLYDAEHVSAGTGRPELFPPLTEVEVKLRLTVSQPECLGVGFPSGAHDQIFVFLSDERTGL
jgi:hypothetical protein